MDARCTLDSECPAGKRCEPSTGLCIAPECTAHGQCGDGLVCRDHRCEPGCLTDHQCAPGERCVDLRCSPVGGDCGCSLAPVFCGEDLNPRSDRYGDDICVPAGLRPATTLVFGSVGCSHCKVLLTKVLELRDELGHDGTPPVLFVQIPAIEATPALVSAGFSAFDVPVVQDTEAMGIAASYGADWYSVAVVDSHGCLDGHWPSVVPNDLDGDVGDELRDAWTTALSGACPEASVGPEPDVVEDGGRLPDTAVGEDTAAIDIAADQTPDDTVDRDEIGPLPDSAAADSAAADTVAIDSAAADTGGPGDTVPGGGDDDAVAAEVCEVEPGRPPEPGEAMPAWSCPDRSTSSATHGAMFSDTYLSELVWIAYFGACT
ncbi:MAG: hypothetical protein CSA66_02050 [Proteobacteria bacterium]|nr:MAG: hypothetical protein CSA66_02050 [Pseudomonadota bacterium]